MLRKNLRILNDAMLDLEENGLFAVVVTSYAQYWLLFESHPGDLIWLPRSFMIEGSLGSLVLFYLVMGSQVQIQVQD